MTQPDSLHDRLRAEINRRLAVAKAAEGADWTLDEYANCGPKVGEWSREVNYQVWHCDDELDGCPDAARGWIAEARHIALHDPADAVRRYEGEIEVLERHTPYPVSGGIGCDHCTSLCHSRSGLGCDSPDAPYPCVEVRSLAHRLGVSVDG